MKKFSAGSIKPILNKSKKVVRIIKKARIVILKDPIILKKKLIFDLIIFYVFTLLSNNISR